MTFPRILWAILSLGLKRVNYLIIIGLMPRIQSLKHTTISVILVVLSIGLIRSSIAVLQSGKRLEDLKKEVRALVMKKAELERSIEYKKTGEYVEERARNDLNLVKPGEKVYVIVGQESSGSGGTKVLSGATSKSKEKSQFNGTNPYKWYKLFF